MYSEEKINRVRKSFLEFNAIERDEDGKRVGPTVEELAQEYFGKRWVILGMDEEGDIEAKHNPRTNETPQTFWLGVDELIELSEYIDQQIDANVNETTGYWQGYPKDSN